MKSLSLIAIAVLTSFAIGCKKEEIKNNKSGCNTIATVRDLRGKLDGCGFVFELRDGKKLEPFRVMLFCGTPPLPKEVIEDPLYNFEFVDGKIVKIGYEEVKDAASICMIGQMVKITCIEEIAPDAKD